jgi:hypothetical protein
VIAEYCEGDALNTYRVWLRHELFRGRMPIFRRVRPTSLISLRHAAIQSRTSLI